MRIMAPKKAITRTEPVQLFQKSIEKIEFLNKL